MQTLLMTDQSQHLEPNMVALVLSRRWLERWTKHTQVGQLLADAVLHSSHCDEVRN